MSVTIDSVFVQNRECAAADLDGHVVLLSVPAGAYLGLNDVASDIWRMLSEPRRVGDIYDALLRDHDVDAETVSRDVLPFLQTLLEQRLIQPIDPDGAR